MNTKAHAIPPETHTLIVGGGLSGLALADMLKAKDHDFVLLEARNRFGGRIKSETYRGAQFDLGPAWFWPGQPRIAALIDRLGLEKFDQFSDGDLVLEDERGQVQVGRGFASMAGSWRLKGGLAALTHALAEGVPPARRHLNAQVTGLERAESGVLATLANGQTLRAQRVILALPPRIAGTIHFSPSLPPNTTRKMGDVATWMAGQAKAVAVYDTPFWRDAGLSGDAMSRAGPMVEIHDASPALGGPFALFGFIGVPPDARTDEKILRHQIMAQLTRLFGPRAAEPAHLFVKDWAHDPFTATRADLAPLYAHPTYGMPPAFQGLWDGALGFAGSEVAPQFGGYVEGALEAAQNAFDTLGL